MNVELSRRAGKALSVPISFLMWSQARQDFVADVAAAADYESLSLESKTWLAILESSLERAEPGV